MEHQNRSTEIHKIGGPFTTVPLGDIQAKPASAIVWMDQPQRIQQLIEMDAAEFNDELNQRSQNIRGEMRLQGERGQYPMMIMSADQWVVDRAVLIAETAHVVPPIGAQGLNMSLRDIETLVRAVQTGALENPKQLNAWARKRKSDIAIRKRGIDLLNQISIAGFSQALGLREYGMRVLERPTAIRHGLMRLGLGQ